jgi:chorismate mutase/prephenate dehydratase
MSLAQMRSDIDAVDRELVGLFLRRMDIVKRIGQYKLDHNIAVLDTAREQEVVEKAATLAGGETRTEAELFMRAVMSLSRRSQQKKQVVYAGVPGAWGEAAAAALFPAACLIGVEQFQDVFETVHQGGADFGVVPIYNSHTGAITENLRLLRDSGCAAAAFTRLHIRHCLLGVKGACLSDIRSVHSHPQGFAQCSRYLSDKNWDAVNESNTAAAAKKVAASGGRESAAIGSRHAAGLWGLEVLAQDIMDSDENRTTFVCIAQNTDTNTSKQDALAIYYTL